MDVSKLASEVFGSGRLEILRQLQLNAGRYSDLAKALRVSEGELSRNLGRLVEAGLATKHPDGTYSATPLALAALAQAGPLEFLARHDEFARTHALEQLSPPFLRRLDDLATCQVLTEPFAIFGAFQTLFRTIDKRFWSQWIIGQTVFDASQSDMQRELGQRLKERRPDVRIVALIEEVPFYHDLVSPIEDLVQARTVSSAPASIALSDTHGMAHFNDRQGRIDLNHAFFGTDPRFLRFLADLVEEGFARGTPAKLTRPAPRKPAAATVKAPSTRR